MDAGAKGQQPPRGQPWIWYPTDMVMSPAWRAMSGPARRVIDAIHSEHSNKKGTCNGSLVVPYRDMEKAGVPKNHVAAAIREVIALGLVELVQRGRGGNAGDRRASTYALTWLASADGTPASNRWRQHTDETAERVLREIYPARRTPPVASAKRRRVA